MSHSKVFYRCESIYGSMIVGGYIVYDICRKQTFSHLKGVFFSFFNWDDFLDFPLGIFNFNIIFVGDVLGKKTFIIMIFYEK